MRKCLLLASTWACGYALRRAHHAGVSHSSLLVCHGVAAARCTHVPLTTASRGQATAAEKRFHCGICKKSFRLEMAAKLHLQQAHGGEGTVEAGAGPGQSDEANTPAPVGVFTHAPPQAPTVVTAAPTDPHERSPRREKPAPKPLHEAEREVPSLVMAKMLSVWDDIGVRRMGGQFVHSSMVMRVFAAKPADSGEPLYGEISPEGTNPFAAPDAAQHESAKTFGETADGNIYSLNLSDAFAMASEEAFGPCRPARCPNPFLLRTLQEKSKAATRTEQAEQHSAPLTPFGQLPMFGQLHTPPPPPSPPQEVPVASTAAETQGGAVVSSPFAAGVADSPFAGAVPTPFADGDYSPFASVAAAAPPAEAPAAESDAAAAVSPFAAAAFANAPPSPFVSVGSPFAAADGTASAESFPDFDYAAVGNAAGGVMAPGARGGSAAAEAPPAHVCSLCEKSFTSYDGLRMHSKAKHSVELPKGEAVEKKRSVPDLPAYIPSPVDLSMTSPFGSPAESVSWSEVELTPFAQSMSNTTIAGRVLDVEVGTDGSALVAVHVRDSASTAAETISVRCSACALRALSSPIARGDCLFVCGSLRLLPVTEESTKQVFSSPVVYVSTPTGVVAKIN